MKLLQFVRPDVRVLSEVPPSVPLAHVHAAIIIAGVVAGGFVAAATPAFAQSAAVPALATSPPPSTPVYDAAPSFATQIYGILDAGVRHVDQVSAAGALTQFASGLNTSRFGIRGTESIDADWRAVFRIESGISPGTGTQANSALFDRTAVVGLGWQAWDVKLGRMEGFGYELAASGITDPLAMALNLPNYAAPAAAGSKAPVLGANPLQALYSYTYGQLRYNNALRVSGGGESWSGGLIYSLGGVAGDFSANSAKAAHLGGKIGPAQAEAIFQQAEDAAGKRSSLGVLAGSWTIDPWKFQAGYHDLRIDGGFNSTGLGNGASGTGILGNSTTVSMVLASTKEDFRFAIADLGVTWSVTPTTPITLAGYRTRSDGVAVGHSTAIVALGKWYLSKRTALYLEVDHSDQSGQLAVKDVSTSSSALAYMTGINVRF